MPSKISYSSSVSARRFNPSLKSSSAIVALVLAGVLVFPNGATALDWDPVVAGDGNGTIDGGVGTWDTTTANWTGNGGNTNRTSPGAPATFGGLGGGIVSFTDVVTNRITFDVSGYELNGTTITATNGVATITNGAGVEADINAGLAGSAKYIFAGDATSTLNLAGDHTTTGDLVVESGNVNIVSGSITGDIHSSKDTVSLNFGTGSVVTIAVAGDIYVDAASATALTIDSDATVSATNLFAEAGTSLIDGTLNVTEAVIGSAATMTVNGTFTGSIVNDGTIDGSATIANGDTITNNGSIANAITNTGTISGNGGSFASAVTNTSGTVDMSNGITGEVLTFDGGLIGGTVSLDVNYAAGAGGTTQSDYVDLGGASSGTLTFDIVSTGGALGVHASPIVIATNLGSLTIGDFDLSSIPIGGSVLYTGEVIGTELVISSSANPAIGGISGGLSLVQSLLGTVINRPSSANVSAVAFDDEDGCNVGLWSRLSGGVADSTSVTTVNGVDTDTTLDATYRGIQVGSDWGCSDGRYAGWNIAYGLVGGNNAGTTTQDVFEGAVKTSVVENDFSQNYLGVYMSAAKNGYVVDLQVRREETSYSMLESVVGSAAGIGLQGVEFDSEALTVSGAVSRAFYSEKVDMTLVPVVGFGWSETNTGSIEFANLERLDTPDRTTKIGFAGISAVKSKVADTGDSAVNYFGTATMYKDFSDDTEATFTDSTGGVQSLSTETIGAFGEVSLGVSYIKLYDVGANKVGARQMNLSARIDARKNSNVSSYGLTLNARLTF